MFWPGQARPPIRRDGQHSLQWWAKTCRCTTDDERLRGPTGCWRMRCFPTIRLVRFRRRTLGLKFYHADSVDFVPDVFAALRLSAGHAVTLRSLRSAKHLIVSARSFQPDDGARASPAIKAAQQTPRATYVRQPPIRGRLAVRGRAYRQQNRFRPEDQGFVFVLPTKKVVSRQRVLQPPVSARTDAHFK